MRRAVLLKEVLNEILPRGHIYLVAWPIIYVRLGAGLTGVSGVGGVRWGGGGLGQGGVRSG